MGHQTPLSQAFRESADDHSHDHHHHHHHGHGDGHDHAHHLHEHNDTLGIYAIFGGAILLLVATVGYYIVPSMSAQAEIVSFIAAVMLALPLAINAFRDLMAGHAEMNELVALAVIAAIAAGEYYEAGIIAFFMILGSLLEHRTALGARKSIESLVRITPTKALRISGGQEDEVEAKDLRPGDVVRVLPGDNIPGDGRVLTGTSSVNQATITGESLPQDKEPGDDVFGGTVNLTGLMEIEITKAGSDTTLGRVKELILQAEMTRTPVMRLADQYAQWYTPIVLMLAGAVYFFSEDLDRAIAMLIVACPCAIILSTPTAMVAALSASARLGLLVKKVTDLEVARNLTAIVFDKTGTLTTGKLNVTRMRPAEGVQPEVLLRAAYAVERHSRHPVARAINDVAERARITASDAADFEEVAGRGVRAIVDSKPVLVGRKAWLAEQGMPVDALDTADADGLSLLYVAQGGQLLGWIGLEDKTRTDAAGAVELLGDLGIRERVMLTGDRASVARKVAAEMHCTSLKAEVLPDEKLAAVDQLRANGHTVAVVGDGVNDAPALAAGDISIAMGAAGSDVAIHSASIALMNNNLNRVPFLVQLSRRTFDIIRQNMVFSGFYVVLTLGLSAFGYIPPILAAFLHVASSIVVVFNSTRLVREGEDIDHRDAAKDADLRKRRQVQLEAVPQPA